MEQNDYDVRLKNDSKCMLGSVARTPLAKVRSTTRQAQQPWFYSFILLAIELLKMNIYVVGTIMINRLGLDKNLKVTRATRSAHIPRGTFTFMRSVAISSMVAFHWWDHKPVHYLCTGAVMKASTIERKVKQIGGITVPCPAAVNNYQGWMGGGDVHDQLRLQAYSHQSSTKFKKYYKCLFLGFVDLALVNAYITHTEAAKIAGCPAMKRRELYGVLQNQLLQLKLETFTGVVATPLPTVQKRKRIPRLTHVLEQNEDCMTAGNVQKRRQRSCKVCALLRTDRKKKSYATTFYCERCSIDDAKLWLCNKIRREYKGLAKTCFEIWHDDFDAGKAVPSNLVVLRHPAQEAGKRKKTRRELQLRGDEADDEAE
ncbi:LOW QUALITY PROTEIN: hypothetical protein PHMEG_00031231 [Phytophthora megakarya]|uniref:PiggyBac transposable element-derived protein domain-containing protein n=1 Tax=Phytophthora megakarya TaxID=4795 RepID=A0A225UYP2_9STRA|nr:LOW QUALITY PROTEIN: hypothetical protein PHMEG_00031231 [Phytophthora megakarya]